MSASPRLQTGLTLVELIMFIVIVGVGIAGILGVMNTVVKSSADPMVRKQALAMADAVLEEVLAKAYANPTGGYTETDMTACSHRALYDDVDDYACFDGVPATAVIAGTDLLPGSGTALLTGYSATVAVTATTLGGVAAKEVAVTVSGGPEPIVLRGYRTSY